MTDRVLKPCLFLFAKHLSPLMPLSSETRDFVRRHLNEDVRRLALRPVRERGVDLRAALEQISGWQTARAKLPCWASTDGIEYPPHISMEQCSSQQTALYKAALASRLIRERGVEGRNSPNDGCGVLVDLTGGLGVDFSFMASGFQRAVYVERQECLCRLAERNFRALGIAHAEVINAEAEDYIASMPAASLVYLDPARRDSHGRRTYAIEDCAPDALSIKAALLLKSPLLMVKLSPMLDWRKAVRDFGGAVCEVHIVAVSDECKELLLVLDRRVNRHVSVHCVNDGSALRFSTADTVVPAEPYCLTEHVPAFLSEPNAAVMKGGCFALLERRFGVRRVGGNSNLFLSDTMPAGFPGRVFAVTAVSTMNRRELKAALSGLTQANITVRNFPLSVAELRRRLRLKDGGAVSIFATTDRSGRHVLLICRRL